jgi:hypothetical protein
MSRAALGAEGDDRRRLHRVDDRRDRRAELAERLERREAAVEQPDDVELLHAEPIRGAARLLRRAAASCAPAGIFA